jgi:hypothetical protein
MHCFFVLPTSFIICDKLTQIVPACHDDPSRPRRMLQRDGRIPLDHGGLAVWQRSQILLQSLHGRVLRVRWAQGDRSGVDSLTVRGGQASSWPHVMLWRLFAICCST